MLIVLYINSAIFCDAGEYLIIIIFVETGVRVWSK
jgi:hypothetical protein